MVYRTHHSNEAEQRQAAGESVDGPKRVLTDQELLFFEEALVLAYPTPEDDEAFREYLRKNGSGGGNP